VGRTVAYKDGEELTVLNTKVLTSWADRVKTITVGGKPHQILGTDSDTQISIQLLPTPGEIRRGTPIVSVGDRITLVTMAGDIIVDSVAWGNDLTEMYEVTGHFDSDYEKEKRSNFYKRFEDMSYEYEQEAHFEEMSRYKMYNM